MRECDRQPLPCTFSVRAPGLVSPRSVCARLFLGNTEFEPLTSFFRSIAHFRSSKSEPMLWVYHSGFPHSDIVGSKPVGGSPALIAAYYVLHQLNLPRHPLCALLNYYLVSLLFVEEQQLLLLTLACLRYDVSPTIIKSLR